MTDMTARHPDHIVLRPDFLAAALASELPTPAVVIDPETVRSNVARVLALVGGPSRWRVHVKTVKSAWLVRMLLDLGLTRFKASTTAEVAMLLACGADDVVLAVPPTSTAERGLRELAGSYPDASVAALLDSAAALERWEPGSYSFFLDVDSGQHRTGISLTDPAAGVALVREARRRGHEFRGVHHYDGHLAGLPPDERDTRTRAGLDALAAYVTTLQESETVPEVVTGGSHTFLPPLDHALPLAVREVLTVSPGTVVLCDVRSLERLGDIGLRPAAAVVCEVLSRPRPDQATVDAGLTVLQVDAGRPHARVAGAPWLEVDEPAQEHLAVRAVDGPAPEVGSRLVLVPRHVDTTIAQFDVVSALQPDGRWVTHPVTARHHTTHLHERGSSSSL